MVSCPILCLTIYSSIYFNTILKKFKPKFSLVKFKYKNDILNLGLKFFAIQIITLIIFQSNNFIIAHTISQSSVTDYNIAFKLIGLMSIVFTIIITPLWSAVTDSYCKGDFVWINNTTNKLNFVWFLLSISGLVILLFSEKIYLIWLGDLETYNFKLLCFLWLYFIIFMYYGIYGNIINGLGKIKLQLVITLITTTFYIPVSIYLSNYYGLYGLVSTMIMMMLINVLWSRLQYHKLMTNTAKGIWNK
jgi:O-antigen/teichoic acid export membrane protein